MKICRHMSLSLLVLSLAGMSVQAADWCCWQTPRTDEDQEVWWFDSTTNWVNMTTQVEGFPASGQIAGLTWGIQYPPRVYLKDGDSVTGLAGLVLGGKSDSQHLDVEIRKGASVEVTGAADAGASTGVLVEHKTFAQAMLRVKGELRSKGIQISTLYGAYGEGHLEVTDGGLVICTGVNMCNNSREKAYVLVSGTGSVITNTGSMEVGNYGNATGVNRSYAWFDVLDGGEYYGISGSQTAIGSAGGDMTAGTVFCSNGVFSTGGIVLRSQASIRAVGNSRLSLGCSGNWATGAPTLQLSDIANTTTQRIEIVDSTFTLSTYDTEACRWQVVGFQTAGTASFYQKNSCVTNCGVRFSTYDPNVASATEPRYEIDGGSLYIHHENNLPDNVNGYPHGWATAGLVVTTNAAACGTFTMRNCPTVEMPRVLTNILVEGRSKREECKYGVPTIYPQLEYVFDSRGTSPIRLQDQTGVVGMFSLLPEGGLQLLATDRLALMTNTQAKALFTYGDSLTRLPNPSLWSAGPFDSGSSVWGATLKDEAKIALGRPLATPVAAGWIELPRLKASAVKNAKVFLKLQPGLQTVTEAVAAMVAAGYDAVEVAEGDYNVCVNLPSSSFGETREDRYVVFDFNARRTSFQVRDNVYTPNVTVAAADFTCERPGLMLLFR